LPEWISTAEVAYNNKCTPAMQVSPVYANYVFNPHVSGTLALIARWRLPRIFANRMHASEEAQAALI